MNTEKVKNSNIEGIIIKPDEYEKLKEKAELFDEIKEHNSIIIEFQYEKTFYNNYENSSFFIGTHKLDREIETKAQIQKFLEENFEIDSTLREHRRNEMKKMEDRLISDIKAKYTKLLKDYRRRYDKLISFKNIFRFSKK